MALREYGQFGAVCGGLCPKLGSAQAEPVFIKHAEPAAADGEEAARVARGLGPQRLAEPAAGT